MALRSKLTDLFGNARLVAAEVAWRWTFGAFALGLTGLSLVRLREAIVIYPEETRMLATRSPLPVATAILQIWDRARPVAIELALAVIPAIVAAWIIASTVGRAYVIRSLPPPRLPRTNGLALAVLNSLRVLSVLLLGAAYFGSSYATSLVETPAAPNYLLAIVVFVALFALALAVWALLHWLLSLACIYAGRHGMGTLQAIVSSTHLLLQRRRDLMSAAAQNSSLRTVAAMAFTVIAFLPLVVYRLTALFWILEVAILLAYCIVSDVLLLARLASYTEIIEPAAEAESAAQA